MKKFLTMLFLFIFASVSFFALPGEPPEAAEKQKTSSMKNETPKNDTKKVKRIETMIAVFDLEVIEGVHKSIARPLTDSIRLEVVRTGKYKVIDRSNMDKVLGEQKLQLSGCVSGECIVEAGQLLGVGKIITGSVSIVGKTYYLSLSLINVESGEIEKSSEDKCKCEIDDLIESSKRLVKRLLEEQVAETKTTPEPEPAPQKPAETKVTAKQEPKPQEIKKPRPKSEGITQLAKRADLSVAYVDLQKALVECQVGKEAIHALENIEKEKKAEKEKELTDIILKEMSNVVDNLAKKYNYDLVVRSEAFDFQDAKTFFMKEILLYKQNDISLDMDINNALNDLRDITSLVVKEMDNNKQFTFSIKNQSYRSK